ncbi:MAG: PDZ domain-containing protein, partial [Verrucomicrobiota bacterium]|nr:PDZ domain-containing protein [Verrucomicrobiota bacterium]
VVGVAFQGYSGDVAQNVGYMIPTPVIRRFLKDIEDGHYDKYMDLSVTTFNLQNPAQRKALGLSDDDRGVVVSSVASAGVSAGIVKPGDVLLSIDGHSIGSDAFVELEGERVQMPEVVERKFKGDEVKLTVLRDKKEIEVTVKLNAAWPYILQANSYDALPRYLLFGGLLFQPLSRNFMEASQTDDLRVHFFYDFFISDEIYKDHPEVIVLSAILPDPINAYLADFRNGIVDSINGVKIKSLDDMAAALGKTSDYYVIDLVGAGRPIVLESKAVAEARERIKKRYNVLKEQNLTDTGS